MMKKHILVCMLLANLPFLTTAGMAQDSTSLTPIEYMATGPGALLQWYAPGDDGVYGTAEAYDIRYSTSPIDGSNWDSAIRVESEPYPYSSGSYQTMYVDGLQEGVVYYFAMKAVDESGNWSALSRCVAASPQDYLCGDFNGDEEVSVADEVHLINFIFRHGNPPQPLAAADATGDGEVNIGDVSFLISYIFRGGPPPICGD